MPSIARRLHRSRPFSRAAVASLSAIFAIGLLGVVPAVAVPAVPGPGYQDYIYKPLADGTGADDVTSYRNQSKLWFNDGRWWGILFDKGSSKDGTYRIQSFNMATQAWTSGIAGAQVDNRNRSHADTLWDGTNLWVISGHNHGTNKGPNGDLRIYKYSYNSTSKTYTIASGFPHIVFTNGATGGPGTLAPTIAKAPSGVLWVTFAHGTDVMVSHSTTAAGTIWVPAYRIPGQGNPITASNDQAAIINLSNGIGVLWSNQTVGDEAFYFQGHKDGDDDATWGTRENAYGPGTGDADGHISLKNDGTGRIIAAVKTNKTGANPGIVVIARTGAADAVGSWSDHTVANANQNGTRPVLVIDSDAAPAQADVFITSDPTPTTRTITRRTAPLSSLNFGAAAIGTTFISSAADTGINDGTSMKQVATAASGIILLAQNIPTRRYLHGCAGTPCPVTPVADFTFAPTSGDGPLSVTFTDTSTGTPATWAWDFENDGIVDSTIQNPSHTFNPGTYTIKLTVSNVVGTSSKTDSLTVTVPPGATYTAITPFRVLNTRDGTGLSGKFVNHVPRSFTVAGMGAVPANAVAITGNLTVVSQTGRGFVFLGPTGSANPTSSTINFPTGDTRANGVTVALSDTGQLAATYVSPTAGATTHLLLDITGYFVQDVSGATYTAITPFRVLNTRDGTGLSGKFTNHSPRSFQVAGVGDVPANAVAITGNLTVVSQTGRGFVFLGPTSSANPTSSTINFPTGDTRANGVTVDLSDTGQLAATYVSPTGGATTHLLLDITGYFVNDSLGSRYFPLAPTRVLNTRTGTGLSGKFTNHSPRSWGVAGAGGVPADGVAITGNLTVVSQTGRGFVFLGPTSSANPTSSTINFPIGDTRANGVTVDLSDTGQLAATYVSPTGGAKTDLLLDVTGYFK